MILLFPNAETFDQAVRSFVPDDVRLAEALVSFDGDGRVAVETEKRLTKKADAELARVGVTKLKAHVGPARPVSCWLQILPVTRDPAPPQLSSQAPILFELETAADLPTIVGEMIRLGNDRQSLRWLAADGDEKDRRVLVRVIGPPYYTLLRALDQTASGTAGAVRAYVEQAPRVWVQLGYSHPFAGQVRLADGQVLLVRPPRDWVYLPDAPFRDVYDILKFELPAGPVEWAEAPVKDKLQVPLRLVAGNAADAAELWVVRGDAIDQLDAFVRDADERITQRLKFAVARDPSGRSVVVLRVTTAKVAPPVLPLVGVVGFKPYYKLPNLYIPAGTRLHPTLRRDAVRKLLAEDTDQLVWLFPGSDGTFTPETLPEDSFRPLEDWVDYVIETNHAVLSAWVDATRFDFEHFVCSESGGPKTRPDDGPGRGKRKGPKDSDDVPLTPAVPGKGGTRRADEPDQVTPMSALPPVEVRPPSEWKVRLDALEKEFLTMDGPLDAPDRQALWPQLAAANTGLRNMAEAAVCWVNGLWEHDPAPRDRVDGWFRAEFPDVKLPVPAAELDRRMKLPNPTPGDVRQLAGLAHWMTYQSPVPAWFKDRLPVVLRYLEEHEKKLPVRTVWLAASRLTTLTGSDALGLARVRDRLLQRLLEHGLDSEKDLPRFLRNAGRKDSDRVRVIQDRLTELHREVRTWTEKSLKQPVASGWTDHGATLGYVDLLFAFALAKLGETSPARGLVESGRKVLEGFPAAEERGIAGAFLSRAFRYRIEQALAQKPHGGLLDPALLEELDQIHAKAGGQAAGNPYGLAHYAIARLREQSRVLEPQEKQDPYADYMRHGDELKKELAELARIKDPNQLARKVRELYKTGVGGKATAESRFSVLFDALPLSARFGEPFTVELLGLVPEVMKAAGAPGMQSTEVSKKQGQLLERALFLAAHFDRREVVQQLVDQFVDLVRAKPDEHRYEIVNVVARQCLRSLRKLGMKDEVDKLLRRLQDVVLGGQTPDQIRQKYRAKVTPNTAAKLDLWSKALQSLLNLAGGWLTFNLHDQAAPILDDARAELIGPAALPLAPKEYTPLAMAYVAALGQGPAESGLARIVELFRAMKPERINNSFTTSKFYSRFHLNLVEETILAVASDDFALGPAGRRWLDEDEYLVRRRIHADMRRHLERSGL